MFGINQYRFRYNYHGSAFALPLVFCLLMATTAAFGQSKTKIYGKVEVQSEFEATLSVVGANLTLEPIAKAESINGEFVIEIESPAKPTMGWLYMLGSVHGVVVEPGEITFEYSVTIRPIPLYIYINCYTFY